MTRIVRLTTNYSRSRSHSVQSSPFGELEGGFPSHPRDVGKCTKAANFEFPITNIQYRMRNRETTLPQTPKGA
ncbi:hypothetical protein C8N47_1098 [Mangrovibacterium marinum]|uniref:Uncharacterized protein n=1 Tax=Mangrovibacterium marinum TaxID=1639118 RepID=A0A2T5C0Y1_9BACT|nr:hypothetical protein C8N47_1098 [Mangrovibacterium marinum]